MALWQDNVPKPESQTGVLHESAGPMREQTRTRVEAGSNPKAANVESTLRSAPLCGGHGRGFIDTCRTTPKGVSLAPERFRCGRRPSAQTA